MGYQGGERKLERLMIDVGFPEPNNTAVKKEVRRLGGSEAWRLKAQSLRLKAKGIEYWGKT